MKLFTSQPTPTEQLKDAAIEAVIKALDGPQEEPKTKSGLSGGRALAVGAVLYATGLAAYKGRHLLREQLSSIRTDDDDATHAREDDEEEPVAGEDDPERAVRAALAIRDWIVEEGKLQVRIAVNTGEALVRLDIRPESGEGMATGDVVNTASRLQSAAPTNGILVGEATYRATSERIEYREHEPVDAKGKDQPVPVWEVVQARARFGVDLAPETRTPLVGREREVELLVGTLARARQQR